MANFNFGYEYRNTFLHNLHPIAAGFLMVFLATLASIWFDLIFLTALLALSFIVFKIARTPKDLVIPLILARLSFFLLGTFTSPVWVFMADPSFFKKLPSEFVSKEILQITPRDFPLLGYTAITYGSLYFRLSHLFKSYIVLLLAFSLVWILNPSDLFQYLISIGMPNHISLPLIVAFRFTPIMAEQMMNIWNAQTLRGRRLTKERNLTRFFKQATEFTYPLARRFVTSIDVATIAVVNRGFGHQKMSPRRAFSFSITDKMVLTILPPILVLLFYLCVTPPWYLGNI